MKTRFKRPTFKFKNSYKNISDKKVLKFFNFLNENQTWSIMAYRFKGHRYCQSSKRAKLSINLFLSIKKGKNDIGLKRKQKTKKTTILIFFCQ